jgi:hypothetical protein
MYGHGCRWLLLLIALMLGVGLGAARAQAQDNRPRIYFDVWGLDDASAQCGVVKTSVESFVALTLRNNGILTSEVSTPVWLVVGIGVLFRKEDRACFSYVSAQLVASGDKLQVGRFRARGHIPLLNLCNTGFLVSGGLRQFRVEEAVERTIKECLGRVEY